MKGIIEIYDDKAHRVVKIFGLKLKFKIKDNIACDFEKEFIRTNFKNIISNNLVADYKKFVEDFSHDDKKKINMILSAIVKLVNNVDIDKSNYVEEDAHIEPIIEFSPECYLGYNKYYLPISYFDDSVFYYEHGIDSVRNFEKIRQGNIIDAGAYVGDSAIVLSKYTDNNIHSFEPMQREFDLLQKTIKMNEYKNIIPIHKGLGDKCEQVSVSIQDSVDKETIDLITLDEYVEKNNINVSLIKTDVEGAEQPLLRGAERTIKRDKPVLLISIYHNTEDFFEIKEMIKSWNLGYTFKIAKNESRILIDTMLVCEVL